MKPAMRRALRPRAGITATEMLVATGLGVLLVMLLGTTWVAFGRPAVDVECRARIQQEGVLAAQSLVADFGGFLADTAGRQGTINATSPNSYQFTGWDVSTPGVLLLNYYGSDQSSVVVVSYQLHGNLLTRTNSSSGITTTVSRYVTAFAAAADPDNANHLIITITISYRNFTTTFTLVGVRPS
jgi:hypothetical protein